MNYKVLGILIAICICLVAVEAIVIEVAAEDNGSYVLVSTDAINETFFEPTSLESTIAENWTREPAYNNTRITQGQCVEIGGTYDVSGVIGFTTSLPYNMFAYYGRYETALEPFTDLYNFTNTFTYRLPDQRIAYYNFLIDEPTFGDRQGYWYQFSGKYERGANKRAFYVSDRCIQPTTNKTTVVVNDTPIVLNPRYITPRHVSDIVLSNDDPFYLGMDNGNYSLWVFGYNTKQILDMPLQLLTNSTEKLIFDTNVSSSLYTGNYNVLFQGMGANGIFDVEHSLNERGTEPKDLLIPALRSIDIVDVTGLQPQLVKEKLITILDQTDDPYTIHDMAVQEPYVDISGYQEIRLGNLSGNWSLLEVTGYTNKMPDTPVTLYYDRENVTKRSTKYPSMTVMVENGSIGDYRTFHGYLPLDYGNLAPGFHTLTAVLPSGTYVSVDFYIRAELEPHHEDPQVYHFVDGNPFYVPPTPVIVEKEVVKEVIKEVIKTQTVYIPVDYQTLATETLGKAIPIVAVCVLIGIPALYCGLLAIRTYAERRTKKQLEVKE